MLVIGGANFALTNKLQSHAEGFGYLVYKAPGSAVFIYQNTNLQCSPTHTVHSCESACSLRSSALNLRSAFLHSSSPLFHSITDLSPHGGPGINPGGPIIPWPPINHGGCKNPVCKPGEMCPEYRCVEPVVI